MAGAELGLLLAWEVWYSGMGEGVAHVDEFGWGDLEAEEADGGGHLGDVGDRECVEGLEAELGCEECGESMGASCTGSRGSWAVRSMWLCLPEVAMVKDGGELVDFGELAGGCLHGKGVDGRGSNEPGPFVWRRICRCSSDSMVLPTDVDGPSTLDAGRGTDCPSDRR